MNGRLPRRPVERYGDQTSASGLHVAHAPRGRYGGLAFRGGRYGGLTPPPRGAPSHSARALRWAGPALRAVVYGHTSDKNKI